MKALMAILIGLCLIGCNVTEPDNRVLLKHEGYFFYLEEAPNSVVLQGVEWQYDPNQQKHVEIRLNDTLRLEGGQESDWWKAGKFNRGMNANEPWYSRDGGRCWHTWTSSEEGYPCVPGRVTRGQP